MEPGSGLTCALPGSWRPFSTAPRTANLPTGGAELAWGAGLEAGRSGAMLASKMGQPLRVSKASALRAAGSCQRVFDTRDLAQLLERVSCFFPVGDGGWIRTGGPKIHTRPRGKMLVPDVLILPLIPFNIPGPSCCIGLSASHGPPVGVRMCVYVRVRVRACVHVCLP